MRYARAVDADFRTTRTTVAWSSTIAGLLSLIGLLYVESQHAALPSVLYAVANNVLGVIFGLAVVSFGWEFLVRRQHGRELKHYLNLGASVSASGLQGVGFVSEIDWPDLLKGANVVRVSALDASWLQEHAFRLCDVARQRSLQLEFAVAGSGTYGARSNAARLGITEDEWVERVQEAADEAVRIWREAPNTGEALHSGSKLTVALHDSDESYDVFAIDAVTIVALAAPRGQASRRERMYMQFEQVASSHPTSFLRSDLDRFATLTVIGSI